MKKALFIILFGAVSLCGKAQVAEAWLTMPDSVCPFFTEQQRYAMLQYAKAGNAIAVDNQIEGKSTMDSLNLSANYLSVQVTANMRLTLTILPSETEGETVCLQRTVSAPAPSTMALYFDRAWNLLRKEHAPWKLEQTEEETIQHF